jgi:hypothetical protein
MARKRTSSKTKKKVARKKVAKRTVARRKPAKAAKKHKRVVKSSSPKPATTGTVVRAGAMALLRAWSPSRYSTR